MKYLHLFEKFSKSMDSETEMKMLKNILKDEDLTLITDVKEIKRVKDFLTKKNAKHRTVKFEGKDIVTYTLDDLSLIIVGDEEMFIKSKDADAVKKLK